jgi:hypothetical protein
VALKKKKKNVRKTIKLRCQLLVDDIVIVDIFF